MMTPLTEEMTMPVLPASALPKFEPAPEVPPHELRELIPPKQFCQVDRATSNVTGWFLQASPPEDDDKQFYVEISPPFSSTTDPRKTPTQTLRYRGGSAVVWEEDAPIADLAEVAIAKTYPDVDAIYQQAIGMRATEYARAEEAARAYLAADPKPAVVSGYITGHAENNPTGQVQTCEWAAQQIIERADAFRWAELQMRNVRFARQADMRAATTIAELEAAVQAWEDFLTWLREMLGL